MRGAGNIDAALEQATAREAGPVHAYMTTLATIGATAPFVGLLGTVYGILDAFIRIGQAQSASLAVVGPAIGEALVATAIGLFAAIPAVLAYNRFARQIDRNAITLETFIEEFSNILQRNAGQPAPAAQR